VTPLFINIFASLEIDPEVWYIYFFNIVFPSIPFATSVVLIALTNYKLEKNFGRVNPKEKEGTILAIRNGGKTESIERKSLVVGDICVVFSGVLIPADGVMLNNNVSSHDNMNDPRIFAGK